MARHSLVESGVLVLRSVRSPTLPAQWDRHPFLYCSRPVLLSVERCVRESPVEFPILPWVWEGWISTTRLPCPLPFSALLQFLAVTCDPFPVFFLGRNASNVKKKPSRVGFALSGIFKLSTSSLFFLFDFPQQVSPDDTFFCLIFPFRSPPSRKIICQELQASQNNPMFPRLQTDADGPLQT